MRLVGAHIDSPCLVLNPNPIVDRHGYWSANVAVYGSPLLRTWFDRDLSIAGRVFDKNLGTSTLIDCQVPVAVIPSLAIHLDRTANSRQKINPQVHINPVLLNGLSSASAHGQWSLRDLLQAAGQAVGDILSFDLRFYDVNPPTLIGGLKAASVQDSNQYLSSARIDNLLSCFAGVRALTEADDDYCCLLVLSDHEEVGSVSDTGAQGNFLQQVLERIGGLHPGVTRRSLMISADGAHALHPNYPERHDAQHSPRLNQGPVIKVNANHRYATSDASEAIIRQLCVHAQIPVQTFVSRNDMPCGTTIGPLVASEVGIATVDVGVAQFAMHSIRELSGAEDAVNFATLLKAFYNSEMATYSV